MSENKIPYKTYLDENEIPQAWYDLRADMKVKPAPLLNPGTGKPLSAEELTPDGRLYMADRQTVLDSYGTTIAVTHKATKGTAAWSSVIVDYVTVEQTVGNVGYGLGVVVHITYDATIVAASTCIVAIECARVGAVLNDGLEGCCQDTTEDTALSATC